jgi:hypothetical protein
MKVGVIDERLRNGDLKALDLESVQTGISRGAKTIRSTLGIGTNLFREIRGFGSFWSKGMKEP